MGTYARGGGRAGGVVRCRGAADAWGTRSVDDEAKAIDAARKTAGSRGRSGARYDDAGTASLRSIEQVFSHPACLRSGQDPEALQQHDALVADDIIAIDGSVSAATSKTVKS
jgi:hypothetical protein